LYWKKFTVFVPPSVTVFAEFQQSFASVLA
jgi:hypothetical protein